LISNPTRPCGFFYDAFHAQRDLYHRLQVSTESNPNITEGRELFRGLADRQWVQERELAWGRGSPLFQANVDGKFVRAEAGQLFTLEDVTNAEARWEDAHAEGRLYIGIDVAGEGHDGDETAFAVRRGRKVLELYAVRGLGPDGIREHAVGLLKKWRRHWEIGREESLPCVVVDRDGLQGARVYDSLGAYRADREERGAAEFRLVGFRGSAPPVRKADTYRLSRDLLFGGLVDAFREGLGIPTDVKLEAELCALRWIDNERGKQVLIKKSDLKERLGRSPDRCDALALSTWGDAHDREISAPSPYDAEPAGIPLDPYESRRAAERGLDPYHHVDRDCDPYDNPFNPRRWRDND
jgi:hypothetical protein